MLCVYARCDRILVGILLCPVIGSFLILQRMTLLGDVIAHYVLPGLSVAAFTGINVLIGAFCSGLAGALFITWIRAQSRIKADSAMAITFSTFFALGIMLLSLLKNQFDLDGLLFGDILGVTSTDITYTLIVTLLLLTTVRLVYKELLLYTFDPTRAKVMGLPINILYIGLMAAITLTVIVSVRAVGVILVISMLVGPALTAYLLVKELHQMMIVGAELGASVSAVGVYCSYYTGVPSGPAIVLASSTLFVLVVLLLSPSQGILTRLNGRKQSLITLINLSSGRHKH
ncbi:Manganese transport system membrane protein MntB [Acaryochloris thomasi RCC1774]|uniref:Manganese transport system membrane protein MntB n=1 Tax=Acaryochloris thomasi RCC1774 TaxID=1764569 RepID=A0A2W1JJ34_9CYAN|nr:metal ABC transporter permease [Acaryochloris thomasi]PZD71515.1 Manganese transport system membrane protein MntB [Acaryochloris thomasi RCC1774]